MGGPHSVLVIYPIRVGRNESGNEHSQAFIQTVIFSPSDFRAKIQMYFPALRLRNTPQTMLWGNRDFREKDPRLGKVALEKVLLIWFHYCLKKKKKKSVGVYVPPH